MYEVDYSEDLRQLSTIGAFLPRSAIGVYDTTNFKISTSAPMSFAKVSLIHGASGDFMAISFNDVKLLTDFTSLVEGTDSTSSSVAIKTYDKETDICGFMSRQTTMNMLDVDGKNFKVDIFTAQADEAKSDSSAAIGIVTAINIRFDDSNIIFMLKSVRPLEYVNPDEFMRPPGFIETSAKDFATLLELM